jgi:hypothetical protein
MWDLFKTLAKGALIGLAIRLGLDIYAAVTKPEDEPVRQQSNGGRQA